jgi:hypothetical protein
MSAIRGLTSNADGTALFCVEGRYLLSVDRKGVKTLRGTLSSRTGWVDMKIGTNQLVIVDGANLYVYDLLSTVFQRVTNSGWLGSRRVAYVGGVYVFSQPNTQTWYFSAIEDATSEDPLDFAQAPSSPDNIVCPVEDHGQVWLFGSASVEPWDFTGAADLPFEQIKGGIMKTGTVAPFSVCALDNTQYWLGRDENGGGIVWRAQGYQPQRISDQGIEQKIQAVIETGIDVTQAIAYAYQQNGRSFYVLTVPGLDTTLCFDISSGKWHDRAELDLSTGGYKPSRATHHAYCYGKHFLGDRDGKLYVLNPNTNNNAGDILVRDRISPHYAMPSLDNIKFGPFELDCKVGGGKPDGTGCEVLMRYSDDGAETWSEWRSVSLGAIGETKQRALFLKNGSAKDRVWHVRVTDDSPFQLVGVKVLGVV